MKPVGRPLAAASLALLLSACAPHAAPPPGPSARGNPPRPPKPPFPRIPRLRPISVTRPPLRLRRSLAPLPSPPPIRQPSPPK